MYFALGAYGWPMYLLQNKTVSVIFPCKFFVVMMIMYMMIITDDRYVDSADADDDQYRVTWFNMITVEYDDDDDDDDDDDYDDDAILRDALLPGVLHLPQPVLAFPHPAVQLSLMNQRLCYDDDDDDNGDYGDDNDDGDYDEDISNQDDFICRQQLQCLRTIVVGATWQLCSRSQNHHDDHEHDDQ